MAVVGIDLGTTNTVVACVRGGRVHVLADEQGRRLLPSVVSFHPNGEVLVGYPAKERRVVDAKNTIASVKRLIGRAWDSDESSTRARQRFAFELKEGPGQGPLVVARGQEYTLPEISAFVLDARQADRRARARRAGRPRRHHRARELQRAAARRDQGRRARRRARGAAHHQRADRGRARVRPRASDQGAHRHLRLRRRHLRLHAARPVRQRLRGARHRGRQLPRRRRPRRRHRRAHGRGLPARAPLRSARRSAGVRAPARGRRGDQDRALRARPRASIKLREVALRRRRRAPRARLRDDARRARDARGAARRAHLRRLPGGAVGRAAAGQRVRQGHPRRRLDAHPARAPARRAVLRVAAARPREPRRGRGDRRGDPGRRADRGRAPAEHPAAAGPRRPQVDGVAHLGADRRRRRHHRRHPAPGADRGAAEVAPVAGAARSHAPSSATAEGLGSAAGVDDSPGYRQRPASPHSSRRRRPCSSTSRRARSSSRPWAAGATSSSSATRRSPASAPGRSPPRATCRRSSTSASRRARTLRFVDNTYLGEVELSGLRAAPRGEVTIQVRFEVDESGTLKVFATDVARAARRTPSCSSSASPAPRASRRCARATRPRSIR